MTSPRGFGLTPNRQSGMTLIEVLVTLVLTSVGLLGVAALQLTTLRNNQDSYIRSQASVLAADILDRMRADPPAVRAGAYTADFNETGVAATNAARDLTAWQAAIDELLPGGDANAAGRVELDIATNVVTITVQWSERPTAAFDNAEPEEPLEATLSTFQIRSEI
jgi:type IV pilus assembly protein PilV